MLIRKFKHKIKNAAIHTTQKYFRTQLQEFKIPEKAN